MHHPKIFKVQKAWEGWVSYLAWVNGTNWGREWKDEGNQMVGKKMTK